MGFLLARKSLTDGSMGGAEGERVRDTEKGTKNELTNKKWPWHGGMWGNVCVF